MALPEQHQNCAFRDAYRLLFGALPEPETLTLVFSTRLDEAGTDGRSRFVVVAGGVGTLKSWDAVETAWNGLMERRSVRQFHAKEFKDREGDFEGWGDLKCENFVRAQEKIIKNHVPFTIAVAIEKKAHAEVKRQMRGVRNFKADSDYGMCFRLIRFLACEKANKIAPRSKMQFLVEQGPWAADAATIYEEIRKTRSAKYRPARHSEMLHGFGHAPKGTFRSLELADYIAGRSLDDLERGSFLSKRRQHISALMDKEFLLLWHDDMLREREHRTAHALAKRGSRPSGA